MALFRQTRAELAQTVEKNIIFGFRTGGFAEFPFWRFRRSFLPLFRKRGKG